MSLAKAIHFISEACLSSADVWRDQAPGGAGRTLLAMWKAGFSAEVLQIWVLPLLCGQFSQVVGKESVLLDALVAPSCWTGCLAEGVGSGADTFIM